MRRRLRVALMVFLLAAPGSATAQGSPSGEGLSSAKEPLDSVQARYQSLRTYRDKGLMVALQPYQVQHSFETVFVRGAGLKLTWREYGPERPKRAFAMWGDRRCLYAYGAAPGAFFNDCLKPARYQVVGDYGFVQHAVPSFFYPSLAGGVRLRERATEVREHTEPSGLRVLILSDRWQGGGQSLWIDPESRHIVRYVEDRLVPSPPGRLPRSELVSVEYHDVELNPRLSASAVWVWPPLSLVYGKILRETALQVAALVVPVGVMFVLACRYGRRERPSGRAIAVRAGLWSFAICWSVLCYIGADGGDGMLPAPAWLLLAWRIVSGPAEVGIVPALWLSPAIPLAAYVAGALVGRQRTERGPHPSGSSLKSRRRR